jgi:hypothetical protein
MKEGLKMINVRSIKKLKNNDGLTLKSGKPIEYKTGYQVGFLGVEVKTPEEAIQAVRRYEGNCGVWYSDGVYYVDESYRISTKQEALKLGRFYQQISIFKWSNKTLVYC